MFPSTRTRKLFVTAGIVAGLAVPAGAQAAPTVLDHHATHDHVGRVIGAPAHLLSVRAGARARKAIAASGRIPAAPRLASTTGLSRAADPGPASDAATAPAVDTTAGTELRLTGARPTLRQARLFGYTGTYDQKRFILANWVNYVYRVASPSFGATFRQPVVREVADGTVVSTPCGAKAIRWNAEYCGGPAVATPTMTWTVPFLRYYFDRFGDGGAAAILAHEYGHGAMHNLGLTGRGLFRYTLYSEGFADCMAGAWMYWMYANHYTDGLGQGDGNEMIGTMRDIADGVTSLAGHGDAGWRQALTMYGWNNGFVGCANWGRQIARG